MRRFVAFLAIIMAAGCSSGLRPDPEHATRDRRITLNVGVDTGGLPLGAYQLVLMHDPAAARIVEIRRAEGSDFPGLPGFDPQALSANALRVTGYGTKTAPRGRYALISVVFEQVGSERSYVSVEVERLYDTSAPPKLIPCLTATLSRPVLDFSQPD